MEMAVGFYGYIRSEVRFGVFNYDFSIIFPRWDWIRRTERNRVRNQALPGITYKIITATPLRVVAIITLLHGSRCFSCFFPAPQRPPQRQQQKKRATMGIDTMKTMPTAQTATIPRYIFTHSGAFSSAPSIVRLVACVSSATENHSINPSIQKSNRSRGNFR